MIITGDCLETLEGLQKGSIQCSVTSPPYWGLRDYGVDGQLGLEATPEEYVENMVQVFRVVRRVLRDDGTLWLNLGDSYASGGRGGGGSFTDERRAWHEKSEVRGSRSAPPGLKNKDLVGIPWRVAFALQADGWYLRSDIIWAKPNPMPESVTDRPTRAHEYIFLLSKSKRYYYDYEAIKEDAVGFNNEPPAGSVGAFGSLQSRRRKGSSKTFRGGGKYTRGQSFDNAGLVERESHGNQPNNTGLRNKRTVWTVATNGFAGAHFATFPPDLIKPCILAGCPVGGTVLDPFSGAGTTGLVATRLNREYIGIELNPEYAEMSRRRIIGDAPLLNLYGLSR